jgi:hypothetical protein
LTIVLLLDVKRGEGCEKEVHWDQMMCKKSVRKKVDERRGGKHTSSSS